MADDNESLDEILSGTTTPEPETTEAQPETTESQPRDEHGRFAPKDETETKPVEEQPETPPGDPEPEPEREPTAPVAAVVAERQKARQERERADTLAREVAELRGTVNALMQRNSQPQQPQPEPVKPPNWYEDPDGALTHALTPVQQQIAQMAFRASRAEAIAEHGKDAVHAAENALKEAVTSGQLNAASVKAQLSQSADPVGDVVRWHLNSDAVRETAMRDKLRSELLAEYGIDPNAPKPAPTVQPRTQTPNVKLPPSLNKVPAGHSLADRDESLDEILAASRR